MLDSVDVTLGMPDLSRVDVFDAVHAFENALSRQILKSLASQLLKHLFADLATIYFHYKIIN